MQARCALTQRWPAAGCSVRALIWLCLVVAATTPCLAQQLQSRPPQKPEDHQIKLDVRVEDALGKPVAGLTREDFSVSDNLSPMKIDSFSNSEAERNKEAPTEFENSVEILFVIDALSSNFEEISRAKQQLIGYLRNSGGRLHHPVTILWLMKSGASKSSIASGQVVIPLRNGAAFLHVIPASSDGPALAQQLDKSDILASGSLAAQGISSEQVQLSMQALEVLASGSADRPSRKMVLWVSPGWPLLMQRDGKMRERLFDYVVHMYTELQRARVTLYAIDPLGVVGGAAPEIVQAQNSSQRVLQQSAPAGPAMNADASGSYSAFLQSPRSVKETQPNAVSLQVLAIQTGGLVSSHSNDLGSEIARCVAEADTFYTLSYDAPVAKQANDYHAIQVAVRRHGVAVRARAGYYAQPTGVR